jgi:hypothetical protein
MVDGNAVVLVLSPIRTEPHFWVGNPGTVTSLRKQCGELPCVAGKLLKGRFRRKMNWVEKRLTTTGPDR